MKLAVENFTMELIVEKFRMELMMMVRDRPIYIGILGRK